MPLKLQQGNLFDAPSQAIILPIDGAAKGMEGNIARAFARLYPDAWEELEYDIDYPIPLGTAKIYPIHEELGCKNTHVIIASTLHHLDVLEKSDKLKIISSALRASLSLASSQSISSVCTGVFTGGWRLDIEDAFQEMVKTYQRAEDTSIHVPQLTVFTLGSAEFKKIEPLCH